MLAYNRLSKTGVSSFTFGFMPETNFFCITKEGQGLVKATYDPEQIEDKEELL